MILGYTSLIFWICAKTGHSQRVVTGHRPPWNLENMLSLNVILGAFTALGGIVRPFGGHALAYDSKVCPNFLIHIAVCVLARLA